VQQRGALDCAVNAAGVEGASKTLLDEDEALFEQVMDTNLRGVWHCLRAQIGQMLASARAGPSSTSLRQRGWSAPGAAPLIRHPSMACWV